MDISSGMVLSIFSGLSSTIRNVIHPLWLLPSPKAFLIPNESITCGLIIEESQYMKFSNLVVVPLD
jgi:hypothetical protein